MPELLKMYRAPWHLTMDGIKSADGVWVMSATNPKLAAQIIELANFADLHVDEENFEPPTVNNEII